MRDKGIDSATSEHTTAAAPGAASWRLVAGAQRGQQVAMQAFNCDTHGHALAIWGDDQSSAIAAQPTLVVYWL